jgi:predicted nucleic acid-binding protein
MEIILDASVLTDIFVKSKPRHELGRMLSSYIKKNQVRVTIPMHAIIEVKCAIDNERLKPGYGEISSDFTEEFPLKLKTISIDQKFLREYLDLSIPYLKAGDLIYILIAKKHQCPFITEDKSQIKIAKSVGIEIYTIKEFLNKYS